MSGDLLELADTTDRVDNPPIMADNRLLGAWAAVIIKSARHARTRSDTVKQSRQFHRR